MAHPPPNILNRISEFQYQRYDVQPLINWNIQPDPRALFDHQSIVPPPIATIVNIRLDGISPTEYSSRAAPLHAEFADDHLEAQQLPNGVNAPPDDYDKDKPCFVCLDLTPDAILLECGHGGLCVGCAERLWQRGRRCPLCRADFTGVVRIVDTEAAAVRNARPGTHKQNTPGSSRGSGRTGMARLEQRTRVSE